MLILKGQNKQCPNPNCKNMAIHENGCSQMKCGREENGIRVDGCLTEWCYICGEATRGTALYGDTRHDATHFLMNLDPPFGSYYALQCCNVNWTIKGIDGQLGPHKNYRQVVSFSSRDERIARQNPIVPSTYERYQQVSRNKTTKEANGEQLTRDEEIEYDKIYGYWIKTQVLYRKFTHINKPNDWWEGMYQQYWAGDGNFQGLDNYHVIGTEVYNSDPMTGFSALTLKEQNELLDKVLAAYPTDKIARLKERLNSINEQIQNAPRDDNDNAIVDIQAIQQNEGVEEAVDVMVQGQQYQVPPGGYHVFLLKCWMLHRMFQEI